MKKGAVRLAGICQMPGEGLTPFLCPTLFRRHSVLLIRECDNVAGTEFFSTPGFHDSIQQHFSRLNQEFGLTTRADNTDLFQKLIERDCSRFWIGHDQGTHGSTELSANGRQIVMCKIS